MVPPAVFGQTNIRLARPNVTDGNARSCELRRRICFEVDVMLTAFYASAFGGHAAAVELRTALRSSLFVSAGLQLTGQAASARSLSALSAGPPRGCRAWRNRRANGRA